MICFFWLGGNKWTGEKCKSAPIGYVPIELWSESDVGLDLSAALFHYKNYNNNIVLILK